MGTLRWYFRGRGSATWLLVIWVLVPVLSVLTWDLSLEFQGVAGDTALTARVSIPVVGVVLSMWCVVPALPDLDVRGRRAIRVIGSIGVISVVGAAAASIALVVLWVGHAPDELVPRGFIGDDDIRPLLWPLLDNVVVVAALAVVSFCLLGRSAGTVASLAIYLGLLMVGANPSWYQVVPYYSHALGVPVSDHPVAATVLAAAAVLTWFKTGGASVWSRAIENGG